MLVLIAAGAYYYLQTQHVQVPSPVPSTSSTPTAPATIGKETLRELTEAPGCSPANQRTIVPYLPIDARFLFDYREGTANIVMVPPKACFLVGQTIVPVRVSDHVSANLESPDEIMSHMSFSCDAQQIQAKVEKVFVVDAHWAVSNEAGLAGALGKRNAQIITTFIADAHLAGEAVALEVKFTGINRGSFSREVPILSQVEKHVIKSEALDSWLKEGGSLIDVRAPEDFQRSHHPAAVNIPYLLWAPIDFASAEAFYAKLANDKFDTHRLPQDRKTRIAFIGEDRNDPAPLRALLKAQQAGWTEGFLVQGGEAARTGKNLVTPDQVSGVGILGSTQVKQSLGMTTTVLIDARSAAEYDVRSINAAKSLPFPDRRQELPPATLKNIPYPLAKVAPDKKASVIFYGADNTDWRPMNAAKWAKAHGWAQVYWLREGLGGWLDKGVKTPEAFKTRTGPAAASESKR